MINEDDINSLREEHLLELRDRARLYCTEPSQDEAWRQAFELGYACGYIDAVKDMADMDD
jgi:hypothetical protein